MTGSIQKPARFWLQTAQIAWIVYALILACLQVASQVAAFRQAQDIRLTPAQIQSLHAIGLSVQFYAGWVLSWQIPLPLVWGCLGFFIFWRRSKDRAGLILSAMMVGFGLGASIPLWKAFAAAYPDWSWIIPFAAFIGNVCLNSFFFVFPNGHFVPRWTIGLVLALSAANILISYDFVFPVALANLVANLEWLEPSFLFVSLISAILGPFYRYRWASTPVEKAQIKWVVFTTIFGIIGFAATVSTMLLLPGNNPLEGDISFITVFVQPLGWIGVFQVIALSIAISILRFRLFDIDLVIRRTLQYSLITGLLGLAYFGGVAVLRGMLSPLAGSENSPFVIVVTTLLIAALFNPARRRIQDFVDRRFYRGKYDSEKALAEFSATARSETDLGLLSEKLVEVVQQTVQPESTRLWLKGGGSGGRKG